MNGIQLIKKERWKQLNEKKWTPSHDDGHTDASLAVIAAKCAVNGTDARVEDGLSRDDWGLVKKYGYKGTKPNQIKLLTIAGALIAAEIDRDRVLRQERFDKKILEKKRPLITEEKWGKHERIGISESDGRYLKKMYEDMDYQERCCTSD